VRRVIIVISLITFLIGSTPIPGHALFSMGCPANPATMLMVLTNSIATLYNVLPIKIGAIPIAPFPGAYETKSSWPLPICFCLRPPLLIPFPGLAISHWEPIEGYEVVNSVFLRLDSIYPSLRQFQEDFWQERKLTVYQMENIRQPLPRFTSLPMKSGGLSGCSWTLSVSPQWVK